VCLCASNVVARQQGLVFYERRDRPFSVDALTEQSSEPPPPPSQTETELCQSQSHITTDGQSVLASTTHLGPKSRFLLLSKSFGFVDVEGPL
jgi:hypothetical protein